MLIKSTLFLSISLLYSLDAKFIIVSFSEKKLFTYSDQNLYKLTSSNNFIEKSQFILITHNKETMKGSHRLYGVTMNKEIGESRIISVDV